LNTAEQYLAVAVAVLFVAGISVLVVALRERKRARNQWGDRG